MVAIGKPLTKLFNDVANSEIGFSMICHYFSLKRFFQSNAGLIPNWAIDPELLMKNLKPVLQEGHMTPMNTAALMCAVSVKHKDSGYDPVEFLENFLALYNADSVQEVCKIEKFKKRSPEWNEIKNLFNITPGNHTKKMEAIKIRSWAKDLQDATSGTLLGRTFAHHQTMTVQRLEDFLKYYNPPKAPNETLKESDGSETLSALPKDTFLPLLKTQREKGYLSETQCGIILCFILHSREQRRNGASYISHPMAVAKLVNHHAPRFLDNEGGMQWMATVAALLHDIGEKSNFKIDKELEGLIPTEVIEAVKCLHKGDDESYFDYLERCANNRLASVAKLCDIYHNNTDAEMSFKREYVYPIAANYLRYRLDNPKSTLSPYEFVQNFEICAPHQLAAIIHTADNNRKIAVTEARDRLGTVSNLSPINKIFSEKLYAHPRREAEPSLHA